MGLDFSGVSNIVYQDVETLHTFKGNTDLPSLLLGVFFGLMIVMALYNLLLYFSLRDRAYLLYVGTTVFAILTTVSTNGLGDEYLWPNHPGIDSTIYVVFAGISMAFSSRFAALFLQLKLYSKRLDQLMWLICALGILVSVLTIILGIDPIKEFVRWIVLLSFPSYIVTGYIIYRKNYKPAKFYLIAWVPYVLGLLTRTMHGAGWLPTNQLVLSSIELGGALEIVLLSFALAYRIKEMKRELLEKELEKEQFKTKLLKDQKVILEQQVERRTKELSRANATKDKFFSIIAHDLRNPMIGLQGVGQKLEYFIKKDRQEKLLEMGGQIDRSIDQLNHLLNNLLNWAVSQTGGISYNPQIHQVAPLIQENIDLYKSLAKSKEVTLKNEIVEGELYADLNAVSTIIRNLLSNAIKFTENRSTVLLKAHESDNMIHITVRDQGKGMSPEMAQSLFKSNDFETTIGTRGEKGFGLGLRLCKEFTEMNQGTISVESEFGKGTSFTVSFPITIKITSA
ncbi:sensor histidine kinase [Pseudotenacibaculum haliotis]|uniref:histidine kinase n=1 Tax=Pseudotenacibaculum haliotis TaxID=1862138 RepID=A0ABW5LUY4_9FLAO